MPQLGETVTEGTILSWAKQVGDTIAEDEVLLEISTDKVDTEVPSPAGGVIREILVEEGTTVSVGTPLVVIAEPGEDADQAPAAAPEPEATPEAAAEPEPEPEPAPAPEAAPAAEAAPAPEAAPEAAPTPAPEPASAAPVEAPAAAAEAAPTAQAAATAPEVAAATPPEVSDDAPKRGVLSPVVRKLADEHGLDLSQVTGTGEGGRITRKDVMAFIDAAATKVAVEPEAAPAPPAPAAQPEAAPAAAPPAPAAPAAVAEPAAPPPAPAPAAAPASLPAVAASADAVPIDRLRRRIAENMVMAKRTAAHVWTSVEVDFENVERVRQAHKDAFKGSEGFSLTYLPFISRATVDALNAYPVVNSAFDLDAGTHTFSKTINLGIAVDLNQKGLVVMSLRGAENLRLGGLARGIRALADKARAGKLEPDDLSGSTFSITNPGPFGSFMSAPIINVPNVAILSTDSIVKRPAVVTLPDGTDTIAIRHIGYLGLTWDHRVFDGSTAVLFLQRIKQNLETWDWAQELS
jgi:2-oxoglutarate dehydrogenase E2 component (dihydrolipoamide succinyltransferase)